jgi:hypothetical protein
MKNINWEQEIPDLLDEMKERYLEEFPDKECLEEFINADEIIQWGRDNSHTWDDICKEVEGKYKEE